MRGPATPSEQATGGPEGLPPFTRNEPVTFRGMFGSYSRLALMAVGDAVLALAGQVAGTYVGGMVQRAVVPLDPGPWLADPFAIAVVVMSTLVFLIVYRGYGDLHRSYFKLGRDVFTAGLWSVLPVAAVLHFYGPGPPPLAAAWLPAGVSTACLLVLWRVPFARQAREAWSKKPVTLVSTQPGEWLRRFPSYVVVHRAITPQAFLEAPSVTGRIVITPDVRVEDREQIVAWALWNQVDLYLVPDVYEVLLASGRTTQLGDMALLEVPRLVLPVEQRALKRAIDLLGGVVFVLIFLPVFVVVPLLIWLEDRGPVFYRQRRVGRDGKLFEVIKFRTMVVDAERETGPIWARQDDPRITRIGQLLRSTRLDELPQLVNILRGDMSLVGPRPERPELVIRFASRNPLYRAREAVKPGITGLAQVMARYDTEPDCKLRFDLRYTVGWGPSQDLLILLRTVPLLLLPSIRRHRIRGRGRRVFERRSRNLARILGDGETTKG